MKPEHTDHAYNPLAPACTTPSLGPLVPAYGSLVAVCAAHDISRSVAFELARKGLLDTFTIGARRYVYTESVRTLPERLAAANDGEERAA